MTIARADLEAALPDLTPEVNAPELGAPVEIVRDRWGIPHIRAGSEDDAFFAQGFATAQDRLWHMDYDRHRALGRWAEFAGEGAVADDTLMRTFGVERAARADLAASSPASRAMLEAYAAGVNAFIRSTRTLPVEYRLLDADPEPWEDWHCLAVYKVRNMLMGTFEVKLWRARLALALGAEGAAALLHPYPEDSLVAVPPGEIYGGEELRCVEHLAAAAAELDWLGDGEGGSNAWAIGGERTASGLPLVAGDSHRGLDTPNVYYQTHIECPAFRVSGYALPGVPGAPHFSHTEHVAWGMTHGFGDYQDLYIERFRRREGALEYAWGDGWLPAEESTEVLQVRDGKERRVNVVRTRHGPIVAGDPASGHALAFSHPGTRSGTAWADTVHGLLLAKNADEAEEALREWTEPVNNFVYADTGGQFGYRYRGRIPLRSSANAWAPVPGWSGQHEWDGQIPFEEMPQARNPQAGFVVTCNNAPTTSDYPHYINTYFAADWRARRITTRLAQIPAGTATLDDMASIHADRESIPARMLIERLDALRPTRADASRGREMLMTWDGRMERDSAAAAIYGIARTFLMAEVIRAALGELADEALAMPPGAFGRGAGAQVASLYARAIRQMAEDDDSCLETGRNWDQAIEDALGNAVAELQGRLGDDPSEWRWGAVHHTRPRHPLSRSFPDAAELLDPPQVPAHGDGDTPQAGGYSAINRCVVTVLSVNRYLHDPSDWRNSRWIVPLGASGHPGSPHYADQAPLWADVETVPQLWDWKDVLEAAETRQTLTP